MKTTKIYVASSWRNDYQQEVVKQLRNDGYEVYDFKNPKEGNEGFSWSNIDPNWKNWTTDEYSHALHHPLAVEGFKLDFNAMNWADICVMVLPCGRSSHTEAGWMKGAGKNVYVFSPMCLEPELMYKIYDGIYPNLERLRNEFKFWHPVKRRNVTNSNYKGPKNHYTIEELHEKYGFDKNLSVEELIKRSKAGSVLHPIYYKHRPVCKIIEEIYGHVEAGSISLSKARELTAAVIEDHNSVINSKKV